MTFLAKPRKADRLISSAARKQARRSSAVRNTGGALPKLSPWHEPKYRAWAVKRYDCGIKGANGHVCGPRVNGKALKVFAHFEPFAKGIKCSDASGIVLCSDGHDLQHWLGWLTFQRRFDLDRESVARRIFESSPWYKQVETGRRA